MFQSFKNTTHTGPIFQWFLLCSTNKLQVEEVRKNFRNEVLDYIVGLTFPPLRTLHPQTHYFNGYWVLEMHWSQELTLVWLELLWRKLIIFKCSKRPGLESKLEVAVSRKLKTCWSYVELFCLREIWSFKEAVVNTGFTVPLTICASIVRCDYLRPLIVHFMLYPFPNALLFFIWCSTTSRQWRENVAFF